MTATTSPTTKPITMAITVSSSVISRPARIRLSKRYLPTVGQPNPGLVTKVQAP